MNKLKCLIFLIILLSLFVLVGCSKEEVQPTSTQVNNEIQNILQDEEIVKDEEIEYIQVVLNSGWENKQKFINVIAQNTNNNDRREEHNESQQQEHNERVEAEQNTNRNNNENEDESEEVQQEIDYPYYIKINYQANVLNIYTKDENGEYTIPYKAMLCSTGKATPRSGVYSIIYKYRWLEMLGGVYAQYCNQVVGNILIHSVPYSTVYDNGSLQYWSYDKLGQSVSAGCIRLSAGNAKWIFDNCINGTPVEFYASEDPGPLGKPEEMKISSYTQYRNWDPTDPAEGNPWKKYFEETTGTITQ